MRQHYQFDAGEGVPRVMCGTWADSALESREALRTEVEVDADIALEHSVGFTVLA